MVIAQFALSQSQSEAIKQLREENTKLRDAAKALCAEIEVLRDVIMHPNPDIEPDNVRLHREKCNALAELYELRREITVKNEALTAICANSQPLTKVHGIAAKALSNPDGLSDRMKRVDENLAKQLQRSIERNSRLQNEITRKDRALRWIVDNPGSHPANMVAVAEDGLEDSKSSSP